MKPLSYITELFNESVIREMTRICDAAGGYNLSQGFPDFEADERIKKAACDAIISDHNQYPVTFGEKSLREAIACKAKRYNKIDCDPENDITVTCGATEAMIASLKSIINPGDEVIIFEPFYENYGPDVILSNATPRYVRLNPPLWDYSHDDLKKAFNERTKAIIINTPHNPTGKVFSRKELEEIAALCLKWDCIAVTDEIYEHILYDDSEHISIASIDGMAGRTVTINSVSKSYAVTGWRVGWAIADEKISSRIRKVHDFFTVGAPTPFQEAAAYALGMPEEYYRKMRLRYSEARDYFFDILPKCGFRPYLPQGSYYIIADAGELMDRLGIDNDTGLSRRLIELTRVATVPGSSFYSGSVEKSGQVRFAFCKNMTLLVKAGESMMNLSSCGVSTE
ncbi:pyridoxal phosphate-dependent aminotransferase [Candidatus Auribacterota bacterium]